VTLLATGVTFSVGGSGTTMRVTTGRQEHGQVVPPVPIPPNLPVVPPRDAALLSVLQQVDQPSWAMVAWNPSGSLLGSINCFAAGDETLEVRETASGTLLATEPLHLALGDLGCREVPDATVVGSYPSLGLGLAWSPQGDRLLVTNRAEGTFTVFHVRHLPASS
jgi:hypothetical protein